MNATRTGKIARLPRAVREELNRRLEEGVPGRHLVAWLNTLPEVQGVLRAQFGGQPINDVNLTKWRHGGYRDWLADAEARLLAGDLGHEITAVHAKTGPPFSGKLATWVAARYAVASRHVRAAEGGKHWRLLRELCHDVVALRRGDLRAQRLEIDREWQAKTGLPAEKEAVGTPNGEPRTPKTGASDEGSPAAGLPNESSSPPQR